MMNVLSISDDTQESGYGEYSFSLKLLFGMG